MASFLTNTMHAHRDHDVEPFNASNQVRGVAGDPLGDGMYLRMPRSGNCARNQVAQGYMSGVGGGVVASKWAVGDSGGAIIRAQSGAAKTAALGFGIEGVNSTNGAWTRPHLINTLLTWMGLTTDVPNEPVVAEELPRTLELLGNAPNPFNPSTTIRYRALDGPATVTVLRLDGTRVATLKSSGPEGLRESVWDGRTANGRVATSGVYLYEVTSGGISATGRMTLLK